MRRGGKSASGGGGAGVLDAGVVLARLDRRHRSHDFVAELLHRSARGDIALFISVVNLAEVLQYARRYSEATGLDPVALLLSFKVGIHRPDTELARRVAALASLKDASIADRFAAATAEALDARLYTTATPLHEALTKRKIRVRLL